MGNRAVIATKQKDVGIYVHWNGGRDSIEAFLLYCRIQCFRPPNEDIYGWARLCQVIANFFGVVPQSSLSQEQFNTLSKGGVKEMRVAMIWAGVTAPPKCGLPPLPG